MAANLLVDILNNAARMAGAYAQISLSPSAGAEYLYDPASNRILNESQYIGYKTMASEAEYSRRIRSVQEYAERYNIRKEIVAAFQPFIRLLLKSDTPALRQKIRDSVPYFGDILLHAYDSITDNQPGMDRVYAGFANTYGTAKGNEAATYASNYIANYIRSDKNLIEGGRKYNAGMIGATLALKQERGFNFEAELGTENLPSYGDIFRGQITSDTNLSALKAAQVSYVDTQLQGTWNATDKSILDQIKQNISNGKDVYYGLNRFYGEGKSYADLNAIKNKFAIEDNAIKNAQVNQEAVIRDTIVRELETDGAVKRAFDDYAASKGLSPLRAGASEEESRAYEESRRRLSNKFINRILTGKIDVEQLGDSETASLLQVVSESENEFGAAGKVVQRLSRRIAEESRLRQAVGQAAWSSLSAEEQQQYKDRYGDIGTAQTYLGSQMMDKFAHASMQYGNEEEAASATQQLYAAQKRANLSGESMTKQYAFIGSITRNKNLTDTIARAAFAWQASAKAQGVELSEEQRLNMNQRFERIAESVQGNNVAMFMTQEFDPNSKLGKLQAALRSGNMTPEQQRQFQIYMEDQQQFINDIAKATHKDPGTLTEEARHGTYNWQDMIGFERSNVLNAMNRSISASRVKDLITKDRIDEHFQGLSDKDLEKMGAGASRDSRTRFRDMLYNVIQNRGVSATKFVTGELSERDIKRLRDEGLDTEADFAEERIKEFKKRARSYRKLLGYSKGEAIEAARRDLGGARIGGMLGKFLGDDEAARDMEIGGVDSEKTGVITNIAEDARENEKKAKVQKSAKQMEPEDVIADMLGVSSKGLREGNDPFINTVKNVWDGVKGTAKDMLDAAKKVYGSKESGKESATGADKGSSAAISEIAKAIRENKELKDAITDLFKPAADNLANAVAG